MSEEEMRVDRCECLNISFEELKKLGSLEAARKAGAGVECGGCIPYLRLTFETGETSFDVEDPRVAP